MPHQVDEKAYPWKMEWSFALFGMVYGRSKVSWWIRFLTTARGESASWTNHTFNVMEDGTTIIESLFEGTRKSDWKKYDTAKYWGVLVAIEGLPKEQKDLFCEFSREVLGRKYDKLSIVKQILDGLISKIRGCDVNLFRRLRFKFWQRNERYNICAHLTSSGLQLIGIRLFKWVMSYQRDMRRLRVKRVWKFHPPQLGSINPDDLWDNVFGTYKKDPPLGYENVHERFVIVGEFGKRPDHLHWKIVDRIERDKERAGKLQWP